MRIYDHLQAAHGGRYTAKLADVRGFIFGERYEMLIYPKGEQPFLTVHFDSLEAALECLEDEFTVNPNMIPEIELTSEASAYRKEGARPSKPRLDPADKLVLMVTPVKCNPMFVAPPIAAYSTKIRTSVTLYSLSGAWTPRTVRDNL